MIFSVMHCLPKKNRPRMSLRTAKTDLPLKELKSTILAIDWEITDDVLDTFIDQLDGLFAQFEDDKVIHTLLKLLKSLGKYVRTHKSKAHPDTIKRIMAVYSALEEFGHQRWYEPERKRKKAAGGGQTIPAAEGINRRI